MAEIKVSKIEITIGDKILELSLDEILELKNILNSCFPDKEYIPIQPYNPPIQPYYDYDVWKVTISNGSICINK